MSEHEDGLGGSEAVPGMEVGRVTVVRYLTDEGVMDSVEAANSEGEELPLTEALGMMRLAEDSLIRSRMEEDDRDAD